MDFYSIISFIWMILPAIWIYWRLKNKDEIAFNKVKLDDYETIKTQREELLKKAETINVGVEKLSKKVVKDNLNFVISNMTSNNYSSAKRKIVSVIEFVEKYSEKLDDTETKEIMDKLKAQYEKCVHIMLDKEEQARIKGLIREEKKVELEIEKKIKEAEREKRVLEEALKEAIRITGDEHSREVVLLRKQIEEAEEKSRRAISQAQLTKSGHVYIVSNIGSFGKNVFKVGMTRRLEPTDRVREISSSSVPFDFDIHAMISTENAPELESKLHSILHLYRVNRVNVRKEFFKVDLHTILKYVEQCHGKVSYEIDPVAAEYYESLEIESESDK